MTVPLRDALYWTGEPEPPDAHFTRVKYIGASSKVKYLRRHRYLDGYCKVRYSSYCKVQESRVEEYSDV